SRTPTKRRATRPGLTSKSRSNPGDAARTALPGIRKVLEGRLKSEARPESKYSRGLSQLKISAGWRERQADSTPIEHANALDRVFVVHGHDDVARLEIESFLQLVRLSPVRLANEHSGGMTVIEKFEHHADVAFAIVLFTPDDIGYAKTAPQTQRARARQNVIFELGYFIARLGRGKVAVLVKEDVEI